MQQVNDVMNVKELSLYLNLHHVTIYRMLAKREIPAARIGGQWRFMKTTIDKWFADKGVQHATVS
jgi:excisionase family DNA binding protein